MSRSPDDGRVVRVCPTILRAHFNAGQFKARVRRGELSLEIVEQWERVRSPDEPRGTKGQRVIYKTASGIVLPVVHRYRRRGGAIGGSGREDPKYLLGDDGTILVPSHGASTNCPDCDHRHR